MIYFLILFMISTSCFAAQQPRSALQKLADNSFPASKYPSKHMIKYQLKKRPYRPEEILTITQITKKINNKIQKYDEIVDNQLKIEESLDTLNISSCDDMYLVRKQYLKLAKQHHPDKEGGDKEKFQDLKNAYDTLVNTKQTKTDLLTLSRLASEIKQNIKDIDKIEQQTISIHATIQQKSQLPYQGKKDESSFLYKLLAWSEKHKLEKQIALKKAELQKYINFILHIPTLEEYSQYLDSQKLTFLDKMMQKNEFIRQQATLHRAKKIMVENPEIIFESSYENIEDKIQDVFNIIVEEIQR